MQGLARNHSDRDEVRRRAEQDFLNLYLEHGGVQRWKSPKCLFHEDKTPSASIFKGRFYCFSCGVNLDVFEFIERIRGVDFKGALAFLAARYSVPLTSANLTEAEKREYARRRARAEVEAAQLVCWKGDMLDALRGTSNGYFHAYHRCLRWILQHGFTHPQAAMIADACEVYEARYQDLDRRIERVKRATYSELLPFFRIRRARWAV
jgi:hypothetical protein